MPAAPLPQVLAAAPVAATPPTASLRTNPEPPTEEGARTEPDPVPAEVAIQPPPANLEGPVAVASTAPPQLAADTPATGGVWAVIIGIDDYPGRAYDLDHAVSDADAVDQALAGFGVTADRRLVLRDGQADRATVLAAASWLVDRAGPDATAVFFYAGHVRHLGGETQALVTADGGVITDDELAVRLAGLPARHAWFLIAACFSGGFTELLAPGRVLTAAADSRSLAYENRDIGGSYLVHFLVQEGWLEGRAGPSVQDAFAHADRRLAALYPNRRPIQIDHAGDPILLGAPSAPAPEQQRPFPAAAPAEPPPESPSPPEEDTEPATPGMSPRCLLCRR